jgi:tetratricopeptide (TPR) repeat protein
MIRRDYILRMIEDCVRALARIGELKSGRQWREAAEALDEEFQRLIGAGPDAVSRLSETELLAHLMRDEPTLAVRDKTLILTALLKEAGDVALAQGKTEESRACFLKALHLLFDTMDRGEPFEPPEFLPTIEVLIASLRDQPLPARTLVLLMRHYEQTKEFDQAENALFELLEAEPSHAGMVAFGRAFYDRLRSLTDADLRAGNLPRSEVEAGFEEWCRRTAADGLEGN